MIDKKSKKNSKPTPQPIRVGGRSPLIADAVGGEVVQQHVPLVLPYPQLQLVRHRHHAHPQRGGVHQLWGESNQILSNIIINHTDTQQLGGAPTVEINYLHSQSNIKTTRTHTM